MMQEERFTNIIEYLKNNKTAKLADFSVLNKVSLDTVRRDLAQLENEGILKRVRGGAVFRNADMTTGTFPIRDIAHKEEKREIASLLGEVVMDGQSIGLNGGTTTTEGARFLAENYSRLTVVTNNIHALEILRKASGFTVIVPGGIVDIQEGAIFGHTCEEEILKYNLDVSLLAINAISAEKGITDFRVNEVDIILAMMKASKRNIILADHSKFEKVAYINVCGLEGIDTIISDSQFPESLKAIFMSQNVRIITP